MNIYLYGMIGTGKTTIGILMAERLGWMFDDLDGAIERLAAKPWRKVIEEEGWLKYREYEYSLCRQWAKMDRIVIALGGGTVRYQWNRDILTGSGPRVHLMCRLRNLAERVRQCDRPRVNLGATMEQDIAAIWRVHRSLYYSFADISYRTDRGKTPLEETEEILQCIEESYGRIPVPEK
jgi:shikimate kinase